LSLTSAGVLSGTPTAAGVYAFTVQATDRGGFTGSRKYGFGIYKKTATGNGPATAFARFRLRATPDSPG
jgi:hypothetical protein